MVQLANKFLEEPVLILTPKIKGNFVKNCFFILVYLVLISQLAAQAPPEGFEKVDVKFNMGTVHGQLKFNKELLVCKPEDKVWINFINTDEMPHNIVICKPGTNTNEIGLAATKLGADGLKMQYIPKSDKILFSTPLIEPGDSYGLFFKAPAVKGKYPFVCTFPGHYMLMTGILDVGGKVPVEVKKPDESMYDLISGEKPVIYRSGLFGPGIEKIPYGVAVSLPGGVNYAFDAKNCFLRAAWNGKFINTIKDWNGRGGEGSKIIGSIYFTSKSNPIYIEGGSSETRFLGFRMVDSHPQFMYRIGNAEIKLLVRANKEGSGIIESYEISGAEGAVTYKNTYSKVKSSTASFKDGSLTVPKSSTVKFDVEIAR